MKTNKLFVFLFLSFLLIPVFSFAQTLKYVAFFPSPHVVHKKIIANKMYVRGDLQLAKFDAIDAVNAEKDIRLASNSANTLRHTNKIYAGFKVNADDGKVILNGEGDVKIKTVSGVSQINAETLYAKEILWDATNKYGFNSSNFIQPFTDTVLCWKELRLKGTYEFRHYLVAGNGKCD